MAEHARRRGGWRPGAGRGLRRAALLAVCASALALAALLGAVNAYGGVSDIVVTDAWARPAAASSGGTPAADPGVGGAMMGGNNSVAYLTIANRGDGRDKLIGVSADGVASVELHHTTIEDNVASMRRVEAVDVPRRGEVRFGPGGYHLVLVNVGRDLWPGDSVALALRFERAGVVLVTARVRES